MAKMRFTDTEKWRDPWFAELPPLAKLVWFYLCDSCDNAGVWAVSKRRIEFELGTAIDLDATLVAFAGRVVQLDGGAKWQLTRFVAFQCGPVLRPKAPPHAFVLRLLAHHGLPTSKGIGWVVGGVHGVVTTPKDTDTDKETEGERERETDPRDPTDLFSPPVRAALERAVYTPPPHEPTVGDLIAVGAIVRGEDRDGWEAALKRHGFPAMEKAIVALRARGAKPWVDAVVTEAAGFAGIAATPRTTKRVIDGVEYTIHDRK